MSGRTRASSRTAAATAPRAVGLRDVARAAGVSVASASVALNGRAGVAPRTRERIVATAAQLGYRANPQAQALRRGRSSTYGLVVRNLANPFFLDVISGAEEVAVQAGATLVVADSQYSLDTERRHVEEMALRLCAGLAIAPVGPGESLRLWQSLAPWATTVALNAAPQIADGVPCVGPDNELAVVLAVRHLAGLGHSRVAFLCAPRPLMADPDRLTHFRRECRALGLVAVTVFTPLSLDAVHRATLRVLRGENPPTAIVTNSDYTALGVYRAVRELELRVGRDVSVVGHDDLPTSELLDPPLATLRVDRRAMGREVMARLLDGDLSQPHVAPVELVTRASAVSPVRRPEAPRTSTRHRR